MKRWWWLPLLGGVLFAWNLWGYDLWAPDEPYFAEGAREMVVDGRWIVPHVNGVVTTDKPPFFFWLIALCSWPAGAVSSLTARLPSVLAAMGSLFLTVRLGRRMWSTPVGVLAGLMLMSNYLFWDKARSAQTDATLSFFILLALSAFEAFRSGTAGGRSAGIVFWIATALAVLTKGPVGILLPLGILLITLATDRSLSRLLQFAPLSGPLCFLAVIAAWVVPASLWDPAQYTVVGALKEHFVDRAVHGMHHAQPFWYYLKTLPVQLMPWSLLVPGALILAWRKRSPADRLLLVTFLFIVVFFSISTEKRDLYVLPAFPAIALMCASLVHSVRAEAVAAAPVSRRWVTWPLALTGILLALVGVALIALGDRVDEVPVSLVRAAGALFLLTGVPVTLIAARRHIRASLLLTLAGIVAVYLLTATLILPALDPVKSARAFSAVIRQETAEARAAGGEVVSYGLYNLPEAFAFYTDGVYLRETIEPKVVEAHMNRAERSYALVDANRLEALPAGLSDRFVTVAQTTLSRKKVTLVHNGKRHSARLRDRSE